ncbi:hypothetical protein KR009_001245 [Drosophila setifemur]|nr:hypothetical protein KR009_001245 [Drosophila setifemur]
MNKDLRLLSRLLFAILLISLLSTLILGIRIHRRFVESIEPKTNRLIFFIPQKETTQTEVERKYTTELDNPQTHISQFELDQLKIQRNVIFRLPLPQGPQKDWHDHPTMEADKWRKGFGERGKSSEILLGTEGFNGLVSDRVALNRSLSDVRPVGCKKKMYLEQLPNVTVIMAFHDEHLSVLLRSLHSLINRSPAELLRHIVLVDDASELPDLGTKLNDYLEKNFPKIIELVRLTERIGFIKARLRGAQLATCEVLVFLDSHIEVGYNWLPPLLEPIVIHPNIATSPMTDMISHRTLEYKAIVKHSRSGFNWKLQLRYLPPIAGDIGDGSQPFRTPVMDGAVAIDKNFFWHLGGYDEELDMWGGDQYDLSFKVWMCGGMWLRVPCSRVGHLNQGRKLPNALLRKHNFMARNYKRLAEVWMDEYKNYVYDRDPEYFKDVDAGSLSGLMDRRKALGCQSFDWYMHKVAPDFLERFPPIEPLPIETGAIQSIAFPDLCLVPQKGGSGEVELSRCSGNITHPDHNQNWTLTHDHEIRLWRGDDCLELGFKEINSTVRLFPCHSMSGNQFWYYNRKTRWVYQGELYMQCMVAIVPQGEGKGSLLANDCHKNSVHQQWNFGNIGDAKDAAQNPSPKTKI